MHMQITEGAWMRILLTNLRLLLYMSQIAEEMKPSPLVISILSKLSGVIPTWKIIPGQDIIETAFKQPEIRKQVLKHILMTYYNET